MGSLGRGMELLPSTEGWPHGHLVLSVLHIAARREDSQLRNRIKKIGLCKKTHSPALSTEERMCICTHGCYREKMHISVPFSPRHEVPERQQASVTQPAGEVSRCASLLPQS